MMRHLAALLPLASILLSPVPGRAEAVNPRQEYRACLHLARQKPEDGWEEALAWQSLGGGEPARHCAAVALIGLGKLEEAARRLEALAQASHGPEGLRADMLAQAAQSWLMAGMPDKALADLEAGLRLVPGHPELLLDKAVALAQAGLHQEVVEVLTTLLKAQPNRVEAMVLRGAAHRLLERLEPAKEDIARALVLDPGLPDALLERGLIRRMEDNPAGAREDWMKAIAAAPDSPVAETARRNLELMDVAVK
ncbi:tetratricopeptide repeat protein [Magnetospirillum sp. SS-4]|uniref:tetratricopeptide repeat protein n=1 Tax=Magnetospirillum sp. SS-4 TaxID=2681465 RepID=UPI00138176F3|nr:tetratricopeptide repeat protein [Magnetospirillum sp. SS-4]CAA7623644.1 TPR repeat-containing protein [Magnetospirillum sp. SS-4]